MRTIIGVTIFAVTMLAGCSTEFLRQQESSIRDKEQSARDVQAKNTQILDQGKAQKSSAVVVSDKTYLGAKPVPLVSLPKPPAFLSRRVELVHDVSSISELIDPLSSIAKVSVVVKDDALLAASRGASLYSITRPGTAGASTSGAAPSAGPVAGDGASAGAKAPVTFRYSGPLSNLLDLVASRFGVSWRYDPSGAIEFYHRDTRTFPVMLLPGDMTVSSDIGTVGGGAGGVAGSTTRSATQKTTATVAVNFWRSLEDSVKAIATRDGVVTVNSSVGTVTVTDTPSALERIGQLIDSQNALLTKQVLLDVKVVNVTLKDTEQLGIDWDLVYTSVGRNQSQLLSSGFPASADGSRDGKNLFLSRDGKNLFLFSVTDSGRKLNGTDALLRALSEQANIGAVTSAQQYALNNQATPIQVGRNSKFVESSTFTPSTAAGVPGTITYLTNTISAGVAFQLLPRILDNQNLLVHFTVDVSDEPEGLELDKVAQVSLYKQNVRNFMQRVALRSGETLVLSGYEKNLTSVSKNGVTTPDNPIFGGKREAESRREIIVIMITPVIMDRIRS